MIGGEEMAKKEKCPKKAKEEVFSSVKVDVNDFAFLAKGTYCGK